MITAVRESSSPGGAARVSFGVPLRRVRGARDSILLFGPGSIVAYRFQCGAYSAGCVFRTAGSVTSGDASGDPVPGVRPSPLLLVGFMRGRRFARWILLLRELQRRGDVDALSDAVYLRAATAVSRPHSVSMLVDSLLEARWTR